MEKSYVPKRFSYWLGPISGYRDKKGRYHPATVLPNCETDVARVAYMLRNNKALKQQTERVRSFTDADEFRQAKARLLPFITPFGVFSRRASQSIETYSGLVPVDLDKAEDGLDLEAAKQQIFKDYAPYVKLAFISPSGRGIKLLVDVGRRIIEWDERLHEELFAAVSESMALDYGEEMLKVDYVGKDLARACFLCHDPTALWRE